MKGFTTIRVSNDTRNMLSTMKHKHEFESLEDVIVAMIEKEMGDDYKEFRRFFGIK